MFSVDAKAAKKYFKTCQHMFKYFLYSFVFIDTNLHQPVQTYSNLFKPVPISCNNYIFTRKSLNIVPTSINKLLVYFYTGSSIIRKPKLTPTCETLL